MAELDLQTLIASLKDDPEADVLDGLDNESLSLLQRAINPYAKIAGPKYDPENPEDILFSVTNVREDYARRFALTAVIGFMFRMQREWKVNEKKRRWKPDLSDKFDKMNKEPFTADDLEEIGNTVLNRAKLLREAEEAATEASKAAQEFNEKEMVFSEDEMKLSIAAVEAGKPDAAENPVYVKMLELNKLMDKVNDAQSKRWGILYTATIELRNVGIEADVKTLNTEEAAMEFKEAKRIIQEHPDRYNGILPQGEMEIPESIAKGFVRSFMEEYFEFDPDAHVRKAYDEEKIEPNLERQKIEGLPERVLVDPFDERRIPFRELLRNYPPSTTVESDVEHLKNMRQAPKFYEEQRRYNTICHLLQCERTAKIAKYVLSGPENDDPDREKRWLRMIVPEMVKEIDVPIPPQDTFHRITWYCDSNLAALREITDSIYNEKADIDNMIAFFETKKASREKLNEWAEEFRDKNQDNVSAPIISAPMHEWVVLRSDEENRGKVNFFNNQTEVLRRIMERHEQDQKMGPKLMANRVRKAKAENIAKEGPDAPGLAKYKESHGPDLPGVTEPLSDLDKLRLAKTKGDIKAANELKHLEYLESRISELESKQKLGDITAAELADLKELQRDAERAKEAVKVPEGTIEIPIWTMNMKEGTATKTSMYTKAAAPGDNSVDPSLAAQNMARGRANIEAAEKAATALQKQKENPLNYYPEGSRKLAEEAFKAGKGAPQLAPFAQTMLNRIDESENINEAVSQEIADNPANEPADAIDSTISSAVDAVVGKK